MMSRIPPEFIFVLVGLLGAIVHAFGHIRFHKERNEPYKIADFIVYVTYGGFAGIMFGILANILFQDQMTQLFVTGMGAFAGFAGLNAAAEWMLKKVGIRYVDKD